MTWPNKFLAHNLRKRLLERTVLEAVQWVIRAIWEVPWWSNIAISNEGGALVEDAYRTSQLNLRVSIGAMGGRGHRLRRCIWKLHIHYRKWTSVNPPTCCGRRHQPKEQRSVTQMGGEAHGRRRERMCSRSRSQHADNRREEKRR